MPIAQRKRTHVAPSTVIRRGARRHVAEQEGDRLALGNQRHSAKILSRVHERALELQNVANARVLFGPLELLLVPLY